MKGATKQGTKQLTRYNIRTAIEQLGCAQTNTCVVEICKIIIHRMSDDKMVRLISHECNQADNSNTNLAKEPYNQTPTSKLLSNRFSSQFKGFAPQNHQHQAFFTQPKMNYNQEIERVHRARHI